MLGRQTSGRHFHTYLNPERKVDEGALAVHGLTDEFLADKPRFAEVVDEFLAFVADAEIIIHNAAFDVGFLNAELDRQGRSEFKTHVLGVTDSLAMARELYPGKRNSLDALCERLGVNNNHRKLHGALLDAQILSDVFLALTRGQDSLSMDVAAGDGALQTHDAQLHSLVLPLLPPDAAELVAHAGYLDILDRESRGKCLWRAAPSASLPVQNV
jgi:DNA polymerase-3 subunit epsilon